MTFIYSDTDMKKIRIIKKLDDGIINIYQAMDALNKSKRTIFRYLHTFRNLGPPGLLHGLKGKPSNNSGFNLKYDGLYKYISQKRFIGFGPTLLAEKLEELLGYSINVETLRLFMIKCGLRTPNKRKKHINRFKRNRRNSYGMLIQFDGSYHDWLENGEMKCLLACIDDATSIVDKLLFANNESLESMLEFWINYFIKFGKPQAIYVDCHATYKVNYPSDQFDKVMRTRFQNAMQSLGIELIYSKCPQGKGRIENSFKTHQDRLVKELRLAGIKDYNSAQDFINNHYLPKYNMKFAKPPIKSGNFHVPITNYELDNIERFFANRFTRTVKNDGTISFNNNSFQLDKNQILKSRKITVVTSIYGNIRLYSGNELLSFT